MLGLPGLLWPPCTKATLLFQLHFPNWLKDLISENSPFSTQFAWLFQAMTCGLITCLNHLVAHYNPTNGLSKAPSCLLAAVATTTQTGRPDKWPLPGVACFCWTKNQIWTTMIFNVSKTYSEIKLFSWFLYEFWEASFGKLDQDIKRKSSMIFKIRLNVSCNSNCGINLSHGKPVRNSTVW